jgi:hypothetical protein
MDNDTVEASDINFPKEIAKNLIISTAVSAGVLIAFGVVGFGYSKIEDKLAARKAKKAAQTQE